MKRLLGQVSSMAIIDAHEGISLERAGQHHRYRVSVACFIFHFIALADLFLLFFDCNWILVGLVSIIIHKYIGCTLYTSLAVKRLPSKRPNDRCIVDQQRGKNTLSRL